MEAYELTQQTLTVPVGDAGLHVLRIMHEVPGVAPSRPALVFLHEGLGSVEQWKGFPATLCARSGCDGIVYDRPGHGKSSPRKRQRTLHAYFQEGSETLSALVEALDVRRPVLVGHSDGATIALLHASNFPDGVHAVVSVAAHVMTEQITIDSIDQARRAYHETSLGEKLVRYHGDKTADLFSSWANTWLDPTARHWNMFDELSHIICPVLALQGEQDAYGTQEQLDNIARYCRGPVDTVVIPHCGHIPHHQKRVETLEAMTGFLSRLFPELPPAQ